MNFWTVLRWAAAILFAAVIAFSSVTAQDPTPPSAMPAPTDSRNSNFNF